MYNVLIVDSDLHELNTLSHMIDWNEHGLSVIGLLSDGSDVLNFLQSHFVDILIINMCVGPSDGIQLLQEIRSSGSGIRVIFTSNNGYFNSNMQKTVSLDVENILVKPVNLQLLKNTLSQATQKLSPYHTSAAKFAFNNHSASNNAHSPALFTQTFERLLRNHEYEQCLSYVDKLFNEETMSSYTSPIHLRNHLLELVVHIIEVLRNYNIGINEIFEDERTIYSNIFLYHNTHDLCNWMERFMTASIKILESKNLRFSPTITRAIAHIEMNYAQEMSLKTMAYDLNINAAYLGQLFKTETGQLFSYYLHKIRIINAKKLLLKTDLPINEIALQCGYNNDCYFYCIFKKYTGQTPSQYRKIQTP